MIVNALDLNNPLVGTNGQGPYAGNVEVTLTPPSNTVAELLALSFTLTTDATAANRVPRLEFTGGSTPIQVAIANVSCTASLIFIYLFGFGLTAAGNTDANFYANSLPRGLIVTTGLQVELIIQNGVAGDAMSVINSIWRIWPDDH